MHAPPSPSNLFQSPKKNVWQVTVSRSPRPLAMASEAFTQMLIFRTERRKHGD
jgi:hypothetical protein